MKAEHIADRLIDERARRGWTQEELAQRSGTSPTTISNLESRQIKRPQYRTLRKLARALGVDVAALYGEEIPSPKAPEYPPVLTLSDEELDKLKKDGGYDEVSNLLRQLTEWFSEHSPGPMTDAQRQEWGRAHPGTDRYLARAAQIIIPLCKRRTELEQASHSVDDELEQMEEYAGELTHQ